MSQDASPGISKELTSPREDAQSASVPRTGVQDWCPGLLSARLVQIRFLEDEESLMAGGGTCGSRHPANHATLATPLPLSSRPERSVVEGSAVRPAALSNPSPDAAPDEPSPRNQALTPNLISLVAVTPLTCPIKSTLQGPPIR